MRASILVLCVLSLLAVSATAAPTLIRVSPSRGVSFDETTVQILGFDLPSTSVSYSTQPPTVPQCPARAFFGQREDRVLSVSSDRLIVLAPPQRAGTKVDVRVERRDDRRHGSSTRRSITTERNAADRAGSA